MKKIFSLFLLAANIAYGQIKHDTFHDSQLLLPNIKLQPPVFQGNLSNDFLKKDFMLIPEDTFDLTQKFGFTDSQDMTAKFSHDSRNGSVYYLMYDNMPCLVPDIKRTEKMPVRKLANRIQMDRMPNSIPQRKIIPDMHVRTF